MADTQYLLIGGGLASHRAIQMIRQQDETGRITLVGAEPYPPYDRPPLSKEFLRGEKPRDQLVFDTGEALESQNVDLVLDCRVTALDADNKRATLDNQHRISFERALLAPGGEPTRLDLPGARLDGVYYLRTVDDSVALAEAARSADRAVIVGAGFIGMEAAASLTQLGVEVTVLEAAPRIWAEFADETLAGFFEAYCRDRGVTFRTGATVTGFQGDGRVAAVTTEGADPIPCDFVLVAVGIDPSVELARAAGLTVDDGIVVDERLRTSHPEIFVAGDVANYPDPIFHRRRRVEHWGHAEYCGQVAGANMAGGGMTYGLLTYVWSDIFDLHLEFAGDETQFDEVLVRGRMDDTRFTVLYLKQHRLTAYFSVNGEAREFTMLKKLIKRGVDLSGKGPQLRDAESVLKELL